MGTLAVPNVLGELKVLIFQGTIGERKRFLYQTRHGLRKMGQPPHQALPGYQWNFLGMLSSVYSMMEV